jgi:hypothetical protein
MDNNLSIIQTLIVKTDIEPIKCNMGFLSPEFNWMSWALSCLQLRKFYDKVELFTNKLGKEILIDLLELPYTKVHLIQDEDIDFPEGLWAYAKLHTYSLQNSPFIHVDGDVFIWEQLRNISEHEQLIVQNIEDTDYYYRSIYSKLIETGFKFPKEIQQILDSNKPFKAINAGIVGGRDLDFFGEYTRIAHELIQNNIEKLSLIDKQKFNFIFEQHLFYCMAQQKNLVIKSQLDDIVTNMNYAELINFPGLSKQSNYLHIVGNYKKSIDICIQLAKQLRQNYPNHYYNIINKCNEAGIDLFFNCYNKKGLSKLTGNFGYDDSIKVNWVELYEIERQQQDKLETLFCNKVDLSLTLFQTNKQASSFSNKQKDGTESIYCKVPVSLLLAFKELQLDELDEIIYQLLDSPQNVTNIYNEIKLLFDEEEIKGDESSLLELINLKLKNGCISNLYTIN